MNNYYIFISKVFQRKLFQSIWIMLIVLLGNQVVKANPPDTTLKHHVIVLLDGSASVLNNGKPPFNHIEKTITQSLPNILLRENAGITGSSRPTLQQGDYISLMSFGFEKNTPDANNFIQMKVRNMQFGCSFQIVDNERIAFQELWSDINRSPRMFFNKHWTGLSFASQLGIHYMGSLAKIPNDVNRTFLVLVTDGEFNGLDDPNHEIKSIGVDNRGYTEVKNKSTIIEKYNDVRAVFSWEELYESTGEDRYNFKIMEYIPVQPTFAIEAVLPIENSLKFKRNPDGNYSYNLQLVPYNTNMDFKVEHLVLTCRNPDTKEVIFQKTINKLYDQKEILLTLDKRWYAQELQLELQAWVWYDNDVYGAHSLHPFGSKKQGREGLTRNIKVYTEQTAKILGFMPLSDSLFSTLSSGSLGQGAVATIWSVIILAFLFILFIIYIIGSSIQKKPGKTSV